MQPHDTIFCVYVMRRADQPFYIGKGKIAPRGGCSRPSDHKSEARSGHHCHRCHAIRQAWGQGHAISYRIVFRTSDEQEAYQEEKRQIAFYGRDNLANATDGGEGQSGRKGELSGQAKLTQALVDEIRMRYATETTPIKTLAREYGVAIPTIEQVVSQHTWPTDEMPRRRTREQRMANMSRNEQHHSSKLDWEKVREIRAIQDIDNITIAARYGVTARVIWLVLCNKAWHDPAYNPDDYVPFKPRALGEHNHFSMLTWADVRSIRARYVPRKVTAVSLAAEYNVNVSCIEKIVYGKTWKE